MSGFDGGITEMLMESNQSGFYSQIYRELQVHQQWFEKKNPKNIKDCNLVHHPGRAIKNPRFRIWKNGVGNMEFSLFIDVQWILQ